MTKQVTPEQLDIWLNDPVTSAYLDAIKYYADLTEENIGKGVGVDPRNSCLTQYNAGYAAGRATTFAEVLQPKYILGTFERREAADAA